jgi:hypothetical protein
MWSSSLRSCLRPLVPLSPSPAQCSQTRSIRIRLLAKQSKFDTHTRQQAGAGIAQSI